MATKTDWKLVWLLWAAGLGAAGQYGKISVIFDDLPSVYPAHTATIGWTVSLVGLVGVFLGVVAGSLVGRIGYRQALLGGLAVGAVMSLFQASFPPYALFLLSRVVEGAAHLALVVAAPTMIAEITSEKDRGSALTLWGTFFGVSFAILTWGVKPLGLLYGPGMVLAVHGAFMLAMALALRPLLPKDSTKTALVTRGVWQSHRLIYSSPSIGAAAWGWLFYTTCFVSVLTVIPEFLRSDWRAFTVGAIPLISIVISMTVGVYGLRLVGALPVILSGFLICVGSCALWLAWPGAIVPAFLLGGGIGLVQGASFALVPILNTDAQDRALANGGLAQMGNLGNTIGTPLMVGVIAAFGFVGLVVALMTLYAAGAIIHLWLARRRQAA